MAENPATRKQVHRSKTLEDHRMQSLRPMPSKMNSQSQLLGT
jgi:hypothetical protein